MKHKILSLSLVLPLVTVPLMAACAAPATAPGEGAAPAEKAITWQIQTPVPASTASTYQMLESLCDAVTKTSNGRLIFKSFSGGAIVPSPKELTAVEDGVIQGALTNANFGVDIWPAASLFDARPGGMSSDAMATWYNVGGGVELLNEMFEGYDIVALPGMCPGPAEVFLHSTKPISSVDDIDGLKIRTAGDGGAILAKMGASVVTLSPGEVHEAVQRGVIDAFELAYPAYNWSVSVQEVAKYVIFSEVRAPFSPLEFFVNKDAWNGLSPDLQQLVTDEVLAWMSLHNQRVFMDSIEAAKNFADYGCEISHLPEEVESALLKEAKKFYDERAAKDPFAAKVLESQANFQKSYSEYADLNRLHAGS